LPTIVCGRARSPSRPPAPSDLGHQLKKLSAPNGPDIVLIDVAGSLEKTLAYAMASANLTLIPATLSEADLFDAHKVSKIAVELARKIGRAPVFRLLLTKVQPLQSTAQRYAMQELIRLQLPMLSSILVHRAAYEEIGLTGLPPHFADNKRETVTKAVEELNKLLAEIKTILPDEATTPATTSKSNVA
jgi:chromosome partitioning protein